MKMEVTTLPKKYHSAVERWRDLYLPDYQLLIDNWEKHFPKEPTFQLCAFRATGMCTNIECGTDEGKPKFRKACEMDENRAHHLLGAVKAQASTEFGSIQQHQLTLSRAQSEEDQFWILRMMAEELRHGYQMFSVLLNDDWKSVSETSGEQMVEEVLEMRTGSHVLGAFNVDFDSFVDNIVFCCLIDRVGKYQLSMQKVSAYAPMAESMPRMLQEEAFHLATGVVPLRRFVTAAAHGSVYTPMPLIQKTINKWMPRGLEMFGDERGGGTNVKLGLKPMKNEEAQEQYYNEVSRVVRDLNDRFLRERLPNIDARAAEKMQKEILEDGKTVEGITRADLLKLPDKRFYRRRGVPAFEMVGTDGQTFTDVDAYVAHVLESLPEASRAGRD
ncbi:phenylacetate-CoA oxygenase subunit PaaI, partial [bacterium]|nr:phenylacetate-CoA oxygenase subunit PaaI [bacterium]